MVNKINKKIALCFLSLIGFSLPSLSYNIDWKGTYRTEFVEIDKPSFTSGSRKSYLLNHLTLSPKIIAADGVNIVSSFEIFNNSKFPNSRVGTVWGSGVNTNPPVSGNNKTDSNVLSNQQPTSNDIQISQLYLNINEEFGSLLVGRAPVHFGLGITHNGGSNPFDHWFETRDIIGYKFIVGNLFIMPSFSKVYHHGLTQGNDITDETIHFEYNNPETGNLLGLFYETRKSSFGSNDAPTGTLNGTLTSPFSVTSYNLIFGKVIENFDFKIEGAFQSGTTGLLSSAGDDIRLSGFALVTEINYKKDEATTWNLKMGSVSGDNPDTPSYEGYILNRNYDVAFLMFNHPMGSVDILKSTMGRDVTKASTDTIDEDGITNALFIAPSLKKQLNSRWGMINTIAWAQLNNTKLLTPTATNLNSNLGFEWDLAFSFKPHDNIEWKNTAAFFFPGDAYKGGSMNLKTSTVIGLQSTAAITF